MLETIRQWFRRSRSGSPHSRVPASASAVAVPTPEQSAAIEGNVQLVRKTLLDLSGTDHPPGRDGIEYLDGFIERTRAGLDDAGRERMGTVTGCYLGAALVAEYGGTWVQSGDGLGVQFSEGNVAYPINKATKHWHGGAGDSVLSFFDVSGTLWAGKTGDGGKPIAG